MPQGLTLEQLQAMGAKPASQTDQPKQGGLTLQQLQAMSAPQAPTQPVPAATTPKPGFVDSAVGAVKDFGIGAVKGVGSTLAGASELGEKMFQAPLKAVGLQTRQPLAAEIKQTGALTPQGTAQKVGFGAEQLGEFLLPGGAVGKTAKVGEAALGAGKLAEGEKAVGLLAKAPEFVRGATRTALRSGAEAASFGGQTAIQTGGDTQETKKAALLGAAFPVAGKIAESGAKLAGGTAERIINSLIKPLQKDFAYGKNPGRGVAKEGIVANSFDDLVGKITKKREELGQAIGTVLDAHSGKRVPTMGVLNPIDEAISKAKSAPRTNAALITRLENLKKDLRVRKGSLSPRDMFDLKAKVADLTNFTGNPSDDKTVNMALKRVYGGIKERIGNAVPDVKALNERFADIKSAEVAAKYRDKIMERQNILPFASKVGGAVVGAMAGGAPGAALGVLASAGAEKILGSTLLKTRAAKLLGQMGSEELAATLQKYPVFKQVIGRLQ